MVKTLYTRDDVIRWENGLAWEREFYFGKLKTQDLDAHTSHSLAENFRCESYTAIANQDWSEALSCQRQSVRFAIKSWDLAAEAPDVYSEKIEFIQWNGLVVVVQSGILGGEFLARVADRFLSYESTFSLDPDVASFANLLLRIVKGETCKPGQFGKLVPATFQSMAANCLDRNRSEFLASVLSSADAYYQFVKSERGFPLCVACIRSLSFLKLARELWLEDAEVDHVLLQTELLEAEPTSKYDDVIDIGF